MRPFLNCRDATRLVLQREDRALGWVERLRLRLHLLVCRPCPRFVRQVKLMRRAMGRWRQYAETAEAADATTGGRAAAPRDGLS